MQPVEEKKRVAVLIGMIVVISLLHYSTSTSRHYFHEIYKTLYYIPIIIAAFHFGIRGGMVTSLSVSIIYLPHVLFHWQGDFQRLLEIVLYNVAAYIVGRLSDSERDERKKYQQTAFELGASYETLKRQSETLAEVEEQLLHAERLSVMGELAASLAHEVRNPLGSIKGAVEILQDDTPKDKPNYRFLQILIKEVDRLNLVIENFLSLAKRKPSPLKEINLQDEVNSVVHILSAKARKEGVLIDASLPKKSILLKADENKFRQVLLNILLNAIAAGGSHVNIDASFQDNKAAPKTLLLTIADTGTGMPEEQVKKIFQPFYTTKEHGTGLGLPISKRITDEYGWDFQIDSKTGVGSRVSICIPLEDGHDTKQDSTH